MPCAAPVMPAHGSGHTAGPTHGKQIGYGRHQHGDGVRHRHRRRLLRVVQQPHEVGVRQVVNQQHHLAGDGGQYLPPHRLRHGHLLE